MKNFLIPRLDSRFWWRLCTVVIVTFLIFRYVLATFIVYGDSMLPTYRSGTLMLGLRPAYKFSEPQRGDVVIISMASERVALLKRVVALAGEEVKFRNGDLFVDGRKLHEPYVKKPTNWNLEPRTVKGGHYYVIGDNRSTAIDEHIFGSVEKDRIVGKPLW